MKALGFRASQKGLELIYDVQPDVPDSLIGDPGRLRQVLVNLVGNAIKFTERGEILVTVSNESASHDTTHLHFTVSDTGIGIAPDKQQNIFDAFSQADGSMARRYGGTGLGLAISARLVEIMGGQIRVASAAGCGSTFHFTARLPAHILPAPRHVDPRPTELRDCRVLVVDDNFTNRRVLQGMLTRWGMRPTAVDGGVAALAAVSKAKAAGVSFPLILLDGQMPAMDGFTLAAQIQSNPDLVGATIMMLTSAGQMGDVARCRELGIAAYLVKPIRQSELLEKICSVLGREAQHEIPAAPAEKHPLVASTGRKVLLAEDNVVNQILALRLLEKRGYQVTVAPDGAAALRAFRKDLFDVVLMDVQMPEMDGFEATARIREEERGTSSHIPIIAMTAHALKGDLERCLAAGMDRYISKPIRTSELFATIEGVIANLPEKNGEPIAVDENLANCLSR